MDYFPIDLYWMDLREHYSGPVTLKSLIDSVSMLDTTHYRITHPGISGLIITAAGPRPRLQSPNLLIEQLRGEQSSTVVLSGEVNPNGLSTAAWFEWGQTTEYDRSTVRTLVGEGFSTVGFESQISDLTANTTYHYRLVAANPADTVFGIDQVFHTSEVTGLRDSEIPSGGFSLEKNYPNPFNPSTVISYSLSVPEHVTLKIYDLHGRVIATLVDRLNQPGRYQVEWKAQGFVTGVYQCRYQAGMFIRTEKLLFMK
jgi:hypothetical protein